MSVARSLCSPVRPRGLRTKPLFLILLLAVLVFLFPDLQPAGSGSPQDLFTSLDSILDSAVQLSFLHIEKTNLEHSPSDKDSLHLPVPTPTARQPGFRDPNDAITKLCTQLRGQTVYLVGPPGTSYQLHTHLLSALKPVPTPTDSAFCAGPSFCHFHSLCYAAPAPAAADVSPRLTPTDILGTDTSLLRYIMSDTLYTAPSPDHPHFNFPVVDNRTGVRVSDMRWTRQASKANVTILSRAPLPAPVWSYTSRSDSWLDELCEVRSANPLGDLFVNVSAASVGPRVSHRAARAALHTTVHFFLPSVLSMLHQLRLHRDYQPILGKRLVLWHGSWFLPLSCADSNLERLLMRADVKNDPWNAYYNAQVYMHDRILAKLLPAYGIYYVSLSNVAKLPESRPDKEKDSSCVGRGIVEGLVSVLEAWASREGVVGVDIK